MQKKHTTILPDLNIQSGWKPLNHNLTTSRISKHTDKHELVYCSFCFEHIVYSFRASRIFRVATHSSCAYFTADEISSLTCTEKFIEWQNIQPMHMIQNMLIQNESSYIKFQEEKQLKWICSVVPVLERIIRRKRVIQDFIWRCHHYL
jgi:hypothetical protein